MRSSTPSNFTAFGDAGAGSADSAIVPMAVNAAIDIKRMRERKSPFARYIPSAPAGSSRRTGFEVMASAEAGK
jgi:hypothetical protein